MLYEILLMKIKVILVIRGIIRSFESGEELRNNVSYG